MARFMNIKHHRHTWLHICMKTQPCEEMTTILLILSMENIIWVCRAMGRTKGLCDLANQQKIFVMDLDAYRVQTRRMGIIRVNESHTKGITCWFWHIVHLPSSGGFSCSTCCCLLMCSWVLCQWRWTSDILLRLREELMFLVLYCKSCRSWGGNTALKSLSC